MMYSRDGLHLTQRFESCRLTAYQDSVGVWTIGWGHTHLVKAGDTCTQTQADAWLAEDIDWANKVVDATVKLSLTQGEHDALVDFVFNIGGPAFVKSTMLGYLNSGNIWMAELEFEKWDHAGGHIISGLLRRREAERVEFGS